MTGPKCVNEMSYFSGKEHSETLVTLENQGARRRTTLRHPDPEENKCTMRSENIVKTMKGKKKSNLYRKFTHTKKAKLK